MMTVWMLYATAVAVLIAAATLLAERGARALRWPARWLWVGAIAGSLVIPVIGVLMRGDQQPALERTVVSSLPDGDAYMAASQNALMDRRQPTLIERVSARGMALAGALDAPLVALWALGSLAILCVIGLAAVRLAHARRDWGIALVDDQFVRVSDDTGPAVVGFAPSEIVLPGWAVAMAPERRAMLLAHEREHIRARDPLLLYAGLAALVVTPWNIALWWQVRRLRLAVEMDCDARVLRACSDVRAYGALLIEVGRRTVRAPLAAAAFSEPATHLERRIHMMLARPPRFRVLRAVTLGVAGLVLAFVACDMQAPIGPSPDDKVALAELGASGKSYNVKGGVDGNRLYAAMREFFPELLRESGDTAWTLMFVQDHTGRIVQASKQPYAKLDTLAAAVEERAFVELMAVSSRATMTADRIELRREAEELVLGGAMFAGTLQKKPRQVERAPVLVGSTPRLTEQPARRSTSYDARAVAERELVAAQREEVLARTRARSPSDRAEGEVKIVMREVPRALGPRIASRKLVGSDILEELDPDLIQSVEVIKGGAIPFTSATRGVIWIQLKQRMQF